MKASATFPMELPRFVVKTIRNLERRSDSAERPSMPDITRRPHRPTPISRYRQKWPKSVRGPAGEKASSSRDWLSHRLSSQEHRRSRSTQPLRSRTALKYFFVSPLRPFEFRSL